MNEEKKLPDDTLDAVSGGLDFSVPFDDRSLTVNDSTDRANGPFAVDGAIKQQP